MGILLQSHRHILRLQPIDVRCSHTLSSAKSPNYCSNENSPMKSPSFSGFPKRITEFPFPNKNILNKADYLLEMVQVRSKYGCHPDTYSRFSSRNSSGTIKTDVILTLIPDSHLEMVQVRSRDEYHPNTYSDHLLETV